MINLITTELLKKVPFTRKGFSLIQQPSKVFPSNNLSEKSSIK